MGVLVTGTARAQHRVVLCVLVSNSYDEEPRVDDDFLNTNWQRLWTKFGEVYTHVAKFDIPSSTTTLLYILVTQARPAGILI